MNKYNEAMARVTVDEEMKKRILSNLRSAEVKPAEVVRFKNAKRYIALAACFAVALIGVLAVMFTDRAPHTEDGGTTGGVISAGPAVEYKNARKLSRASGVKIKDLRNLPFAATETEYLDYGTNLAEICYSDGAQYLYYRACKGSGDPSGDFNEYERIYTQEADGITVTLKGSPDLIYCAIYEYKGFSYSIGTTAGLTWPQIEAMLP